MDIQNEFRELFLRHGPSPAVESFFAEHQDHLESSSILEETFRRVDLGPRETVCRQGAYVSLEVAFLLRLGASFQDGSWQVQKLLEDTYRHIELGPLKFKRREGACLSPEVEFLCSQGASFERVPCGLSRLIEETTKYLQQSGHRDNFLFKQIIHSRVGICWYSLLGGVLKSVDDETLCHIVRLITRQQQEFEIHTLPSETIMWPFGGNYVMNLTIKELSQRSDTVILRVQKRTIIASRALLQVRSPYFKKLFNDNLQKVSFEIRGMYKTIDLAVKFASWWRFLMGEFFEPCDSRQLTENTLDELINLLYAANTFEMPGMFRCVEQYIVLYGKSFIYAKNAQEIRAIAKDANAGSLERCCDAFIATNLRTFTLFSSLPPELRMNTWRQIASQIHLIMPSSIRPSSIRKLLPCEIRPHIAVLSRVCRESESEVQRVWGEPLIVGINVNFDIIWLDPSATRAGVAIYRSALYIATPALWPSVGSLWEDTFAKIIDSCPCLEALYLITATLTDSDEFEYCRVFTNKEPTTLVEARIWIEENAHQRIRRVWHDLPHGCTLPRIMLIDQNKISRLALGRSGLEGHKGSGRPQNIDG